MSAAIVNVSAIKRVLAEVREERMRQVRAGYDASYDSINHHSLWRQERTDLERQAQFTNRPLRERRAALVKIAALAVAQIEAIDRRFP
jgi:hypothetical protein